MKIAPSAIELRLLSRQWRLLRIAIVLSVIPAATLSAQTAFNWQQIKEKFETANPTLKAARMSIDESKAEEITAYLRPNPNFTLSTDGTQLTPYEGIWRPFAGTQYGAAFSYLHERQRKRELRLESAKKSTEVAASAYSDQERNLIFNLRSAFVQTLQAKAVLQNARQNLDYWDKELDIFGKRLRAGDLAQ